MVIDHPLQDVVGMNALVGIQRHEDSLLCPKPLEPGHVVGNGRGIGAVRGKMVVPTGPGLPAAGHDRFVRVENRGIALVGKLDQQFAFDRRCRRAEHSECLVAMTGKNDVVELFRAAARHLNLQMVGISPHNDDRRVQPHWAAQPSQKSFDILA